ncbi:unnamed protein product [Rhizoctonia solani]|uniref:Protein kinase domain-containing protein n=1 Tax=Rhizoctonia solani TaxID=456999 RepID=A0A8H3C6G4_9AGAM|nr:unnamed protein product [Rhizoctonia solani]
MSNSLISPAEESNVFGFPDAFNWDLDESVGAGMPAVDVARHADMAPPSTRRSPMPVDAPSFPKSRPRGGMRPKRSTSSAVTRSTNKLSFDWQLKPQVDRIFFNFLNRVCSNLAATDNNGKPIHHAPMNEGSTRSNGSSGYRSFEFRIQAFTNGFMEELANDGYPSEVIPVRQVRSYLLKQPFISRCDEEGQKAKSRGNYIWKVEARQIDGGGFFLWDFFEFKRKIVGEPPKTADRGRLWQWTPYVWDPHICRADLTVKFFSSSLPYWLFWNGNVLSGIPGLGAVHTDITVYASVLNDPDNQSLSHTFHITVVSGPLDIHTVMQVLASAVSRVTYAAQIHNEVNTAAALLRQQKVLGVTAQAVADEVRAGPHPDSQSTASILVAAARSVVVGAAQLVATDRAAQAKHSAINPNVMAPLQNPISLTEVSVATQSAVAHAVAINGPMTSEVEVMMTANALIREEQIASTNKALDASQTMSHLLGDMPSGSANPRLSHTEDYQSRSVNSLGHLVGVTHMNVGLASGLGPGFDVSVTPPPVSSSGGTASTMDMKVGATELEPNLRDLPGDRARPLLGSQPVPASASVTYLSSSKQTEADSGTGSSAEFGHDNYRTNEDEYTKAITQKDRTTSVFRRIDVGSDTDNRIQSLSSRNQESVRSNEMTSLDMFECLVDHGCLDLRTTIHPGRFSSCRAAEGAFGDVWKGQLIDGIDVAVKVLRYALVSNDGSKNMKRAMREIYNWSKLNHKNVHQLLGVTIFDGRLGMVSKWMEHGTLQQYLKQHNNIDRHALCPQVAEGVAYLHSVDMIHGDLKACNILVSADGTLKLTDFDYSIISGLSLAFSATTRTGGGTLRWMAPELVLATDEDPTERSKQTDVYALGMTILASVIYIHI